jgi:hypothetical protein
MLSKGREFEPHSGHLQFCHLEEMMLLKFFLTGWVLGNNFVLTELTVQGWLCKIVALRAFLRKGSYCPCREFGKFLSAPLCTINKHTAVAVKGSPSSDGFIYKALTHLEQSKHVNAGFIAFLLSLLHCDVSHSSVLDRGEGGMY